MTLETQRQLEAVSVDRLFIDRWSPRSFSPEPLSEDEINTLFEAARWAPSSGNSQPWHFYYATEGPGRKLFNSMLNESNRRWAPNAPRMMYVVARTVAEDGRVRGTASFDTGAAWMSLALQARLMGLYAHAMGGIQRDRVYEVLGLSKNHFDVVCGVAVGRHAGTGQLPEDLQERERPSARNPIDKIASNWQL